jgi:hypothetical protein
MPFDVTKILFITNDYKRSNIQGEIEMHHNL